MGRGNPWPTELLAVHLGGPEGEPWGGGSERRVGWGGVTSLSLCGVSGEGWPGLAVVQAGRNPPSSEAQGLEMQDTQHRAAVYLRRAPGALWWQPRVGETCLVFHSRPPRWRLELAGPQSEGRGGGLRPRRPWVLWG